MRRLINLTLSLLTAAIIFPSPALACSRIQPPTIEQLAGVADEPDDFTNDAVTGVYQVETVAIAPNMGLREGAAATVVTRYWGLPPTNLGIQVDGGQWLMGILFTTDCDPGPVPPPGESGYGFSLNGDPSRYVSVQMAEGPAYAQGTMHGDLTAEQVAALDERFGPHEVVPVSAVDRAAGLAAVWWPNLLLVVLLAGIVYLIVRRIQRRRGGHRPVEPIEQDAQEPV